MIFEKLAAAVGLAVVATAATFTASISVGSIEDTDVEPAVLGTFDFGGPIIGTISSVTSAGILPRGTAFTDLFALSAATLTDLTDVLLSFSLGRDWILPPDRDCSGVDTADFTMTVETTKAPIPLPASSPLLLAGLIGGGAFMRRHRG